MVVEEKSNSIIAIMAHDEYFMKELEIAIKRYKIKEAWLRGFGAAGEIDYGILEKTDPIFFKKIHVEKLTTISSITALVVGDQFTVNFSGIDIEGNTHIGRLFDLKVAHEFQLVIEILKTE